MPRSNPRERPSSSFRVTPPCHAVDDRFPSTAEGPGAYDPVLLNDVGADTLQITPRVADGETDVDRCRLLAEHVADGGAVGMIGGYMSFAGKHGAARYGLTAVDDVLPVTVERADDRVSTSRTASPSDGRFPRYTPSKWPSILGYNLVEANPDATVWVTVDGDPLLVVGDYGNGSAVAFTTDCAPHWAPESFLKWEYLPTLWSSILDRVSG